MVDRSLTDEEMVEILERICRDNSNKAAQIAAIKLLREITKRDEEQKLEPGVMDAPARRTNHLRAV